MSCSTMMQQAGAWSCFNLTCQALLTPCGKPYLSWGFDGNWGVERSWVEVRGKERNELWLACNMNKKNLKILEWNCFIRLIYVPSSQEGKAVTQVENCNRDNGRVLFMPSPLNWLNFVEFLFVIGIRHLCFCSMIYHIVSFLVKSPKLCFLQQMLEWWYSCKSKHATFRKELVFGVLSWRIVSQDF